jgi:hypothetical protein
MTYYIRLLLLIAVGWVLQAGGMKIWGWECWIACLLIVGLMLVAYYEGTND